MKTNPIPFIIILLLVAAGIYFIFFMRSGEQPAITQSAVASDAQTRFQALVTELGPITFDTTIFTDPTFRSLVNLTTPVMPETQGRLDPFARLP